MLGKRRKGSVKKQQGNRKKRSSKYEGLDSTKNNMITQCSRLFANLSTRPAPLPPPPPLTFNVNEVSSSTLIAFFIKHGFLCHTFSLKSGDSPSCSKKFRWEEAFINGPLALNDVEGAGWDGLIRSRRIYAKKIVLIV